MDAIMEMFSSLLGNINLDEIKAMLESVIAYITELFSSLM